MARALNLGGCSDLSLSAARPSAKELRAQVALGHDGVGEKQCARPPPPQGSSHEDALDALSIHRRHHPSGRPMNRWLQRRRIFRLRT